MDVRFLVLDGSGFCSWPSRTPGPDLALNPPSYCDAWPSEESAESNRYSRLQGQAHNYPKTSSVFPGGLPPGDSIRRPILESRSA